MRTAVRREINRTGWGNFWEAAPCRLASDSARSFLDAHRHCEIEPGPLPVNELDESAMRTGIRVALVPAHAGTSLLNIVVAATCGKKRLVAWTVTPREGLMHTGTSIRSFAAEEHSISQRQFVNVRTQAEQSCT